MTDAAQRRRLPPSSTPTVCPKCRSTTAAPIHLSERIILSTGAPWAFINHRWPDKDDDPYAGIDWPEEWLGWTCRCGYRWETRCADDE